MAATFPCCACCWSEANPAGVDPELHANGARDMHDVPCDMCERASDYRAIFGRDAEAWREALGALRLTLTGDPDTIDVPRAQAECEELVRVLDRLAKRVGA